VPAFLTEQGRLFDSMDKPISGSATFVFRLYLDLTGGTAVWMEAQTITLDAGFFSAKLGDATPIPAAIFESAAARSTTLYLGITVNSDQELAPREALSSVPYAFVAGNVLGDITPHSVSVNGHTVIDGSGAWVGPTSGPQGAPGPPGPAGSAGPAGPPGHAGVMGVGVAPLLAASGPSHGQPLNSSTYFNFVYGLSGFNVGPTSTSCQVTSTGLYCVDPFNNGMVLTPPTGEPGVYVAYRASGGTSLSSGGACQLPQPLQGAQCVSCTIASVVPVTPNTSYDFGCNINVNPLSNTGGYCQAAVVCF
jgi:hypothetical protein